MSERSARGTFLPNDDLTGPDAELPNASADEPVSDPAAPAEELASDPVAPVEEGVSRRTGIADIVAKLGQIETTLGEVQRTIESNVREQRHQEFSLGRLLGSILQALVAGLLLWALVDWLFSEPHDGLLIKLAFAAVLQLAALTGFTLGRERD